MGMRSLSAAELIRAWERGWGQSPVDRALTLLAAVSTESREDLARVSVGRRDARLLEIYEQHFGRTLRAFAECPECGERLEYSITTRDLARDRGEHRQQTDIALVMEEISLRLRPPNSLDLNAVMGCADLATARRMLAERCIVEAHSGETSIDAGALPDVALEQVAECLAKTDPQADVLLDLTCSACGHGWQVIFDIESFLWAKVTALAKRLLREVHLLAGAYGWAERDILMMSALRREFYLEMVA
jgi:hypothetical protein